MRTFEINNKKYVALTDAYTELGINPSFMLRLKIEMSDIRNHIIKNHIPTEHIGKAGRYGIAVIDIDGLTILATESLKHVRNKDAINSFLGNMESFLQVTPHIESAEDPIEPATLPCPTPVVASTTIACKGNELIAEMFNGDTPVRIYTDATGMRWVMASDIYTAIKIDKDSAKNIFKRIRDKTPSYIRMFNIRELMAVAATAIVSEPDKYFPELKMRGTKDRIYLNKYGIVAFLQEIDIERINDETSRELCYSFRDWITNLVGDVLSGDVYALTKPELDMVRKKIRTPSQSKTLKTIVEQFTIATCVSTISGVSPEECIQTALESIETQLPHIQNIGNWKAMVTNHFNTNALPAPKAVITAQNPDIEQTLNELIAKVTKIEKGTINSKYVLMSIENNGMNGNKIMDDAETLAANLS
jgi:hypothetical protein